MIINFIKIASINFIMKLAIIFILKFRYIIYDILRKLVNNFMVIVTNFNS